MKCFSASFTLAGEEPTEILDVTTSVREAIQQAETAELDGPRNA